MKQLLKSFLKSRGYEVCSLYPSELEKLPNATSMTFREAQAFLALGNPGQLSLEEARLLSDLVRESDPQRPIIEVGTLFGFSTMAMTLAKQSGQRLITVDNYCWNPLGLSPEVHRSITRFRLNEAVERYNVEIICADKDSFYKDYSGPSPTLFFCDADHSYEATKADLLWAQSVGASIICGDDYDHPFQRGTAQAVDELGGPKRLAGGLFVL